MKIAVLSDIHGNYPALEKVVDHIEGWKPDMVFVAGDIVNRGPRSADCLSAITAKQQKEDWIVIRGNHEDYVINRSDAGHPANGSLYDLHQPIYYVYQQLNNDVSLLRSLPDEFHFFTPEHGEVRMRHASMRNNRDGIYPETEEIELKIQIAPAPKVFITGHTHRPFVRVIDDTLIVNAGSVGLPFDGDFRTGYAQITHNSNGWSGEIVRLEYNITQAERDFHDTGYIDGAGPIASIVLLELKSALSQLYHWSERFSRLILDGNLSVLESTERFLEEPISKPYW